MFVQIVHFKLKPEASAQQFLAYTSEMVDWLRQQEGFLGYELCEGTDSWSDRLVWENKKFAESGSRRFLDTKLAQDLTALVKDGYTAFFGSPVMSVP